MNELGSLECFHLIDLNRNEQPYHLPYTSIIKRIEDTERRIEYLLAECRKHHIQMQEAKSVDHFHRLMDAVSKAKRKALPVLFDDIESDVADKERFMLSQNERLE